MHGLDQFDRALQRAARSPLTVKHGQQRIADELVDVAGVDRDHARLRLENAVQHLHYGFSGKAANVALADRVVRGPDGARADCTVLPA